MVVSYIITFLHIDTLKSRFSWYFSNISNKYLPFINWSVNNDNFIAVYQCQAINLRNAIHYKLKNIKYQKSRNLFLVFRLLPTIRRWLTEFYLIETLPHFDSQVNVLTVFGCRWRSNFNLFLIRNSIISIKVHVRFFS